MPDLRAGAGAAGDIAALLTNLEPRDVLFIDEIPPFEPRWRKCCIRRWRIIRSTS